MYYVLIITQQCDLFKAISRLKRKTMKIIEYGDKIDDCVWVCGCDTIWQHFTVYSVNGSKTKYDYQSFYSYLPLRQKSKRTRICEHDHRQRLWLLSYKPTTRQTQGNRISLFSFFYFDFSHIALSYIDSHQYGVCTVRSCRLVSLTLTVCLQRQHCFIIAFVCFRRIFICLALYVNSFCFVSCNFQFLESVAGVSLHS